MKTGSSGDIPRAASARLILTNAASWSQMPYVAENMNGDDALAFLRVYAAKIEDPVWTVFSE
jgi:hypothetical protein